jgi:predicted phage terminase large subunit-like protein
LQCYGIEPFTLLLSHTDAQVVRLFTDLKEPILNETGEYDRLHRVFGDRLRLVQNNDHNLVFADGSAIVASSRGASTRGMKRNGKRPGRVIIDDLENEETVATNDQREKTWSWLTRTVQPMLDPVRGRTVWVGTLLHEDAAMPRAEASGSYRVIKRKSIISEPTNTALWDEYEAIWTKVGSEGRNGKLEARAFYEAHKDAMDAGVEVAWPTRFPYIYLREERRRLGSFAFSREYQNEPVASENQIIRQDQIQNFTMEGFIGPDGKPDTYLKGENGVVVKLSECVEYIAIDPAISEKSTADYFALAVMAAHPTGSRWFLDFVHDRFPFDKQITVAVQKYVERRQRVGNRVVAMGIETVMYQKALKQAIDKAAREAGLEIPTVELRPVTDKILRLTRHQPTFEQGLVYMQKTKHAFAVAEVCGYTRDGKIKPANDDAMDTVVYDLMLAEAPAVENELEDFTFDG